MKRIPALLLILLFLQGDNKAFPALLPEEYSFSTRNKVAKETLENGLGVFFKNEPDNPVVTIVITVGTGPSFEGEYLGTGISHFMEHMLFKGTSKRKAGDIEKEVKAMGGTINASTGLDTARYSITVPSEHFKRALELMDDMIFSPSFDTNELEKERNVILKEIKLNKDDPARRVMKNLWQEAYARHPYGQPVIGHEGLFRSLTRDDLALYHASRYIPNNAAVTIVGDVEKDTALHAAREIFAKRERKRIPLIPTLLEPEQNAAREFSEGGEINLAYIAMGFHTVSISHEDLYALDVLAIILGNWEGSRLNKSLVKEKELLYSVNSFNYTPLYPGLFVVYGIADYPDLDRAEAEILSEIERIKNSGVDEDELEAAKNIVVSTYIHSLETTDGSAGTISQTAFLTGEPSFHEKYVGNVRKLDKDTLRSVAIKYLRKDGLTLSVMYPGYMENATKRAKEPGEESYASPAKKTVLPNGIRLILKEDRRLPKVNIVVAFLGGLRAEKKELNGISNLTASMLLKGTKKRTEDQIQAFVERNGGYITHFSGKNTFGLSLDYLKENEQLSLDILEDVLKDPTFPASELEKEKNRINASIKAQDDDIYTTGFLRLRKELFGEHPYSRRLSGEPRTIENITVNEIRNFYLDNCAALHMVIAAVGDFAPDDLQGEMKRRFSSIKKKAVATPSSALSPITGKKVLEETMQKEQSLILAGFRGTELDNPDRYALSILASVLSGENGRLYSSVRNTLGLSYALGTFSEPGIDTGSFVSYIATDKDNLEEARAVLLDELEKISRGDISEEEIELAKSEIIGSDIISLQSAKALCYRMALDEIYGIGFDSYTDFPNVIRGISRESLMRTAAKYIDPGNVTLITIMGLKND